MIEAQRRFYVLMLALLEDIADAEGQQPVDVQRINEAMRILGRDYTTFMSNIKAEVDNSFFSC
jgi:hypothetical protein